MPHCWWGRLPLEKTFGFARNRYVIIDYSRSDESHARGDALPLRLFLVQSLLHGLIATLLIVSAAGLGWF
ncbi:hypothetical protein A9W99_12435 [Mycobacterium sp. 1164966.3]|nr:hypothetical protein A9W99_12435 [Mycobacterium sp. 1164966.3]